MEGIIRKALSGFYYVDDGTSLTACRGGEAPATPRSRPWWGPGGSSLLLDNGQGAIDAILPRKTSFSVRRWLTSTSW